ncbi:hypothetical protein Tco_0724463 [Tanacetum coccineum]
MLKRSGQQSLTWPANMEQVKLEQNRWGVDCNKVYKEAGNEEFDSIDQVESVKTSKAFKEIFLEFKDVSHDFIPDERCVWIDLVVCHWASWAPEIFTTCERVPYSLVLREEMFRGVESDLVDSLKKARFVNESVLVDCGNVTTDDNEYVRRVIAPEKTPSTPPSTPPGND